jgi:uncharacterized protein DUF1298
MLEYLPYVPLSQGVRIGVSILSYNGKVRFGVTGDYDTVPEVEWFCRRIEAGVAELAQLARAEAGTEGSPARRRGREGPRRPRRPTTVHQERARQQRARQKLVRQKIAPQEIVRQGVRP